MSNRIYRAFTPAIPDARVSEHECPELAVSERLPNLADALVHLGVDVIVAMGTPAAQAAKQATVTIPIVMLGVTDPIETGLVANLARPGGNLTGVATWGSEFIGKQLEGSV